MNEGTLNKKGLLIEDKIKGLYINKKRREDLEELANFVKVFSQYNIYDYWKGKEIDACQGELSNDSIFVLYGNCAPMPCCAGFNKFTYGKNPKFAAGYLKYIVLGNLACTLLVESGWVESIFFKEDDFEIRMIIPDIDFVIYSCKKCGYDKHRLLKKVQHIVNLCNAVFYESDVEKQLDYLMYAADKFNEYFEYNIQKSTGWNFYFQVFNGADDLKDKMLEHLEYSSMLSDVKNLFSKSEWNNEDKEIMQAAIDYII